MVQGTPYSMSRFWSGGQRNGFRKGSRGSVEHPRRSLDTHEHRLAFSVCSSTAERPPWTNPMDGREGEG